MPAKIKRKKPLNLLMKIDAEPATKLIEIASAEGRSASAQAKIILVTALNETAQETKP